MTSTRINNRYFEWMCNKVSDERYMRGLPYKRLLKHLHDRSFVYTIGLDGNRAEDGTDLRYRFGYENNYDQAPIAEYLDQRSCSVLEMMIALAIRCEDDYMGNSEYGNRTGKWFWSMIDSLGLTCMSDERYDKDLVDDVLDIFLDRRYDYDGKGGLFTLQHPPRDVRSVEIWCQMMWYLNEVTEKNERR